MNSESDMVWYPQRFSVFICRHNYKNKRKPFSTSFTTSLVLRLTGSKEANNSPRSQNLTFSNQRKVRNLAMFWRIPGFRASISMWKATKTKRLCQQLRGLNRETWNSFEGFDSFLISILLRFL